jgi:hypothetical protein
MLNFRKILIFVDFAGEIEPSEFGLTNIFRSLTTVGVNDTTARAAVFGINTAEDVLEYCSVTTELLPAIYYDPKPRFETGVLSRLWYVYMC